MLGKELFRFLSQKHPHIYGISRGVAEHLNHIKGDITDPQFVEYLNESINPDIIIHCAAYVNLTFCEQNKIETLNLHIESTRALSNLRARLIYISTDSVFDGVKGNYSEDDEPRPLNYYASTKLAGEKVTLSNPDNLVLRMNIYSSSSSGGSSLAEWGIKSLKEGKEINGFNDVLFNPLHVGQASELIDYFINNSKLKGIWHLGCAKGLSKFDFLVKMAAHFDLDEKLISSKSSEDFKLVPTRPKNTILNCDKFNRASGLQVQLDEGIARL